MEAKTVQHAYFAGRSTTSLPTGGHSAILEIVQCAPCKKPLIGAVHPEGLPEPNFRVGKLAHTLQLCEYLLKIAEELPCFTGVELVKGLAEEAFPKRLIVSAFIAGFLLSDIQYEDSLEVNTLAAVLQAGIVQRSEIEPTVSDYCKLLLGELPFYIRNLIWHEWTFEALEKNKGRFQVPGPRLKYFDGTISSQETFIFESNLHLQETPVPELPFPMSIAWCQPSFHA